MIESQLINKVLETAAAGDLFSTDYLANRLLGEKMNGSAVSGIGL